MQVAHLFFFAIGGEVVAALRQGVAVAEVAVGVLVVEVERLYLGVLQGEQFVALADAVLVCIAPNAQMGKDAVILINAAIAVVVVFGQGFIAVGGTFAVFEQGVVAEEFAAMVDGTVLIAIEYQKAVCAFHPAGGGADAFAGVIEEGAVRAVKSDGLDTVAVKVKGEGVVDVK